MTGVLKGSVIELICENGNVSLGDITDIGHKGQYQYAQCQPAVEYEQVLDTGAAVDHWPPWPRVYWTFKIHI